MKSYRDKKIFILLYARDNKRFIYYCLKKITKLSTNLI